MMRSRRRARRRGVPAASLVTQLCLRGNEAVTSLPEDHQRKERWSEQGNVAAPPRAAGNAVGAGANSEGSEAEHLNPEIPNRMGSQETEGGRP